MIKVNIKTLIATTEIIPNALQGLSTETLRNLQTELNPVPDEFKDIEFWDEVDITPAFDSATHTLDGTEILTADSETKTVKVLRGIRVKTAEELEAERKASVPNIISMRQARLALLTAGLLATVTDAILNGSDEVLKIEWEYATEIRRDWKNLIDMTTSLGITEQQLDELFISASSL